MSAAGGELLSMAAYGKLRGLTYKQLRRMREKGVGRWEKQNGRWLIRVYPDDTVPGVDMEFPTGRPPPVATGQPELPLGVPGGKEFWQVRKLKADALFKEQQNENFLFRLLSDFLDMYSDAAVTSLEPVRQALRNLELPAAELAKVNRAWDEFEREFEERAEAETRKLWDKILGTD